MLRICAFDCHYDASSLSRGAEHAKSDARFANHANGEAVAIGVHVVAMAAAGTRLAIEAEASAQGVC
jgi:hypothetical protein